MIYKISNLLLFTALICVCLAWWVDHKSQSNRQELVFHGGRTLEHMATLTMMTDFYHHENPEEYSTTVDYCLVSLVLRIFKSRENIELFYEEYPQELGNMTPTELANRVLKRLGLSADQYFERLRELRPDEATRKYSEPGGEKHQEFKDFLLESR